jgi:hypothetical protein
MNQPIPNDELLSAYLDNEVTPEERLRVEERLATDDQYAATLAAWQQQRKQLQALQSDSIDVRQRVLADVQSNSDLSPKSTSTKTLSDRSLSRSRTPILATVGTLAALILVGVFLVMPPSEPSVSMSDKKVAAVDEAEDAEGVEALASDAVIGGLATSGIELDESQNESRGDRGEVPSLTDDNFMLQEEITSAETDIAHNRLRAKVATKPSRSAISAPAPAVAAMPELMGKRAMASRTNDGVSFGAPAGGPVGSDAQSMDVESMGDVVQAHTGEAAKKTDGSTAMGLGGMDDVVGSPTVLLIQPLVAKSKAPALTLERFTQTLRTLKIAAKRVVDPPVKQERRRGTNLTGKTLPPVAQFLATATSQQIDTLRQSLAGTTKLTVVGSGANETKDAGRNGGVSLSKTPKSQRSKLRRTQSQTYRILLLLDPTQKVAPAPPSPADTKADR